MLDRVDEIVLLGVDLDAADNYAAASPAPRRSPRRRGESIRSTTSLRNCGARRIGLMSRGPTRHVRRLVEDGAVTPRLLAAADHEADLPAHPYIGVEHRELARPRPASRSEPRTEPA
jgi:hypothetical protein